MVYDEASDITSGPTPGAVALLRFATAHYPPGSNLGIWVKRPVRGSTAPSMHSTGRAVDVGFPGDVNRPHGMGSKLAADLVDHHAELGVQCVIFARRIWSTKAPYWHAYTGVEGHWTHVHIELTRAASRQLTEATIGAVLGGDDMTAAERAVVFEIQQVFHDAGFLVDEPDGRPGERTRLAAHAMKNYGQTSAAALTEATAEIGRLKVEIERLKAAGQMSPELHNRLAGVLQSIQWCAAETGLILNGG